uniref:Lysosome-associated membrane glycoprotein 5 n=1 Tax=Naja naja TaxID=35670 RepID=A0A8C6XLQ5_NAJNA
MERKRCETSGAIPRLQGLLLLFHALAGGLAEQEVENLSGLSPNPEKAIFVVRENGTTCLMAEFAAKLVVPYEIWASNFVDETRNKSSGSEAWWKMSKVQFIYDSSESTYFKGAVNPGKHTVTTRHLSALVTPAGKSYECQAQQTITLSSGDHQKSVVLLLSEVRLQPFDISSDFVFSEEHKCPVDQREQLEETLPLILGLILGLVIVVTLGVYHIHLKMTANQVQIPRDRSEYKHMG